MGFKFSANIGISKVLFALQTNMIYEFYIFKKLLFCNLASSRNFSTAK